MLGPWLTSGGNQIRFRSFMDFSKIEMRQLGHAFFLKHPSLTFFHVIVCKHIRETPSKLKTRRTCRTPHLREALH